MLTFVLDNVRPMSAFGSNEPKGFFPVSLVKPAVIIAFTLIAYHLYVIFYSILAYHDIFESLFGLVFGLVIFLFVYYLNVFSD